MKRMESLVNLCLIQHEGGEKFFDAIDEGLRNDNLLIQAMIDKVLTSETFDFIITSGKFGEMFKKYCKENMDEEFYQHTIVVNGGLRNNNKIIDFSKEYNISNKKVIFIDDSFYLGRTRDKIKQAIEEAQGTLINTYVFYDGSKEKDETVHSFYRYYDHYE